MIATKDLSIVKRGLRKVRAGLGRVKRLLQSPRWLSLPVIRHFRCVQLRRVTGVHPKRDKGTSVVRAYWHQFLVEHQEEIRGDVLEIGNSATVRHYGGTRVQRADVLDIIPSNREVTLQADLAMGTNIPSNRFDCFVNQFTMHLVYDFKAALLHSIQLLRPGGVLLVNFVARSGYPAAGFDLKEAGKTFVYWWFTPASVERALAEIGLSKSDYELRTYGNHFSLLAYLAGIPAEELTPRELEYEDPDFPLLMCVHAVKPSSWRLEDVATFRNSGVPEVAHSLASAAG
jgi:SAM-dependent methyltransferase